MENLEIYIASEQPTTCPKCGARTEIVRDYQLTQINKCLSIICSFSFILEFDNNEEI